MGSDKDTKGLTELKKKDVIRFLSNDFANTEIVRGHFMKSRALILDADFVYVDPPYLITDAFYNRHWSEEQERYLYELLTDLNNKGKKFLMSNMVKNSKGTYGRLEHWLNIEKENGIKIDYIDKKYGTSGLKSEIDTEAQEVLVYNYLI